jgi:HAD superfamily hydrolase (TIGR01549 family)
MHPDIHNRDSSKPGGIVAFDLDGVLIDSLECMRSAWIKTCLDHKLKIPFELYQSHIGKPFPVILNMLGIVSNQTHIQRDYITYCSSFSQSITLYPSVIDTLCILSTYYHIAIVTSKPKVRTIPLLRQLDITVDIILCPEDVSIGKPHPESLFYLNTYFQLPPSRSIFVGDMKSDYDCALAAGWTFVYAKYGFGELDDTDLLTADTSDMLLELIRQCHRAY